MSQSDSLAEQNARVSARGNYIRWLAKRFGDLDLLLTREGEDRVSLHKIYVPLRLDTQDRADEAMGDAEGLKDEQPPGQDAREIIAAQPFVAISGRPGSGKTTLVQAIIGELASDRPSEFRRRLVGRKGILPVPLILRDYQEELPQVQTLDELLDHWWRKAAQEAADKGLALDVERLRRSYADDGDRIPLLILFDGIDEVGGESPRRKLLGLAVKAAERGWRVVVTGRPPGFRDLEIESVRWVVPDLDESDHRLPSRASATETAEPIKAPERTKQDSIVGKVRSSLKVVEKLPLHHVQPFAWLQIHSFIERFFLIRDEWKAERERFIADFDAALRDPQRGYLLTLARRPIFLTLMALVHANDRRMPHGRADLYRRIIDLYLVRQTQQRRLRWTHRGREMPHWDEREVRRALGYLAWRSQQRGAEAEEAEKRDARQVIWTRAELLAELQTLLDPQSGGGFREIRPPDATELLDYFLHPTGLLVEPAEDRFQFAHLSFQEYLCAEYIQGRALALGSRRFLDGIREQLYVHLGRPGWDEVGLLLLCIQAAQGAQTERTAHLELLAELDPADLPQARLLIAALTGQELDYSEAERRRWLPLVVATALVQPEAEFPAMFHKVPQWRAPGLELLRELFRAQDPFALLEEWVRQDPPNGRPAADWEHHSLSGDMRQRWENPTKDAGWEVKFGPDEARAHALLRLVTLSGWAQDGAGEGAYRPIVDPALEQIMVGWLNNQLRKFGPEIFYTRVQDLNINLPIATFAGQDLNALIPFQGDLWEAAQALLPIDHWLLQGEILDNRSLKKASSSLPWINFYPVLSPTKTMLPRLARIRLALGCYQTIIFGESLSRGPAQANILLSRSDILFQTWRREGEWHWTGLNVWSRPLLRFILMHSGGGLHPNPYPYPFLLQWLPFVKFPQLNVRLGAQLKRLVHKSRASEQSLDREILTAIGTFCYRYASLDWFDEQAEDPDLMRRRGLRPGQPLPPESGLFDANGRIREQVAREAVVRLRAWLEDDDQVLNWFFPEGLTEEIRTDLLDQLRILHHYQRPDGGRGQPWSPIAMLDAALADWPEAVLTREMTQAAAERDLLAVLDTLFPE